MDDKTLFIPAKMDDYGLTAAQWRIICRISRRESKAKPCHESNESMAGGCKLSIKTVKKALVVLTGLGVLKKEYRHGMTSHYRVNPYSKWKQPSPNQNLGRKKSATKPIPDENLDQKTPYKGSPIKDTPIKDTPEDIALSLTENPKPNDSTEIALKASSSSSGVLIPLNLKSSPQFMGAWDKWQKHLSEKRSKPTPTQLQAHLDELTTMGAESAVAALENSIASGYPKPYPPRKPKPAQQNWQGCKPCVSLGDVGRQNGGL